MASWYIYSAAAGTASGADWANAKLTIAAAITAGSAGDTYYIADDHAESAGATTLTPKGTTAAPDRFLCVRRTGGSVPPVSADLRTTGSVTTTTTTAISFTGNAVSYWYGVKFLAGGNLSIASSGSPFAAKFVSCYLKCATSTSAGSISLGANTFERIELYACTLEFARTAATILANSTGGVSFIMVGGSVAGATLPTTLFNGSAGTAAWGDYTFDGVDLSLLGSGKTLIGNSTNFGVARLANCKLGSSVTVASTPAGPANVSTVDLANCDSGATGYRQERYSYQGTLTSETTIVRSTGASDGVQALTHKIVTTANANQMFPFEAFEMAEWIDSTGSSVSLTVEMVTDNVTLKNTEAWIEVQALDGASFPLATSYTAGTDVLATGTNITTSSATWTTSGLGTPVKQKMAVTFTPATKGYVRCIVKVAKASTTVYVDPYMTIA